METLTTDILILGAGGAGLFAALHAKKRDPDLDVTIAVKGLLGKCGCTRMVQGGYNVALAPGDSIERHFMDTIEGGAWINDQELAPLLVRARATLMATGGGPTMYLYHTPSGDKSCDGMAMALRAGLPLRDMEMVQFHPTGLLAGPDTRMTGTVLEEGLRGSGGHLLNGAGERFMHKYDQRGERATRDIVSRGMFQEMREGSVTPNGGLYISMGHLVADHVRKLFKGMVERCDDCGFD